MWKGRTTLCKNSWRVYRLLIIFSASGFPVIIKFQPATCNLQNIPAAFRSTKQSILDAIKEVSLCKHTICDKVTLPPAANRRGFWPNPICKNALLRSPSPPFRTPPLPAPLPQQIKKSIFPKRQSILPPEAPRVVGFMWRCHVPKWKVFYLFEVLVPSDVRPTWRFRKFQITCNMNFQVSALRDIQIAAREGCRVNKMTNRAVLRLDEVIISIYRSSRVITFRFKGKTQWQMFLLLYGRHRTFLPMSRNVNNFS